MGKIESVLDSEIHKIIWDFEIQTDPGQKTKFSEKRTCHRVDFAIPADHRVKKKKKKKR